MKTHKVAILALEKFVPFDLTIPYNIFQLVRLKDGRQPYSVCFCGVRENVDSKEFQLKAVSGLDELERVDTIIIPGIDDPFGTVEAKVLEALRRAAANNVRVASICTGACVLAAAGLLNGLRATTHWSVAEQLAGMYPQVQVEPDILYVDNGTIMTSAGLASGIDLCLHIIRKDYGAAVAENVAKFIVMPIEREGRQTQLVRHDPPQSGGNLNGLLLWLMENLHREHSLNSIALQAGMSPRTLNRKFQEQLGVAPMTWITTARVKRAQILLESSRLSIEDIATAAGFGTAAALRERFQKTVGTSPTAWRKTYV